MTRWDHQPLTNFVFATSYGDGDMTCERFYICKGHWLGLAPWMRRVENTHQEQLRAGIWSGRGEK